MSEHRIVAIACASADGLAGEISGHFGHAPHIVVAELAGGQIVGTRTLASPDQGSGRAMAAFVDGLGANVVLVGGIGPGARHGLDARGIAVVAGVRGNAGVALQAFASGSLLTGEREPGCAGHGHGHDGGCGHHH